MFYLGNYLARKSDEARTNLSAAKIISVPWDVHKGSDSIEKPVINNLLGRHLAGSLCRTLRNHLDVYKDVYQYSDIDIQRILRVRNTISIVIFIIIFFLSSSSARRSKSSMSCSRRNNLDMPMLTTTTRMLRCTINWIIFQYLCCV